ncbi:hypothetical protein BGW36DRAFT_446941, partial [Talaromyces proteolyticus]
MHRDFARIHNTNDCKSQPKTKRQVKAVGSLYVRDANRLIKHRHDGDLLRIAKTRILGESEPEQEPA